MHAHAQVPGLLEAKPHEVKKCVRSQARAAQRRPVQYRQAQGKKKEGEAEVVRLEAVRDERAENKRSAAEAAAKLAADFERCPGKGKCSCGVVPCPMEKYEICAFCPCSVSGRVPRPQAGKMQGPCLCCS